MYPIFNINHIPEEYIDDPDFTSPLKTVLAGDAAGSEKIYLNIDFVKPGGASVKYHAHSMQEEIFLILSGTGLLRVNGEELPVKAGDVFSKPAGRNIAHQFLNDGTEILRILDVGTREREDVVTYPDENTVLIKSQRMVFRRDSRIADWSPDPNGTAGFSIDKDKNKGE